MHPKFSWRALALVQLTQNGLSTRLQSSLLFIMWRWSTLTDCIWRISGRLTWTGRYECTNTHTCFNHIRLRYSRVAHNNKQKKTCVYILNGATCGGGQVMGLYSSHISRRPKTDRRASCITFRTGPFFSVNTELQQQYRM